MAFTPLQLMLFVVLSGLAAAALAYAALQPRIASERKAGARLSQYKRAETDGTVKRAARERQQETAKRRRSIQNSLKEVDDKQKVRSRESSRPPMDRRIEQAGLKITERQFLVVCLVAGLASGLAGLVVAGSLVFAAGFALVGGFGLPRWVIDFLRKRRQKQFIEEFPNAVDLIVRGVKSGLPLNDTLRMIATETKEPVRSEFQKIVEALQLGISMPEAVERLYQNVPLSETNFFAIVISIQAQAGGNLSEALGNLSRVLRDRKKMKAKIQAMSMEAKASGTIIGALPIIVGSLVYLTTPDYISILFRETAGHFVLLGSAIWMSIGIFVMKQMISFDF